LTQAWEIKAAACRKSIAVFNSVLEFEEVRQSYPGSVPIYIDSDLNDGTRGEDYAKELHKRGFTEIFLATGYDKDRFSEMYWIKDIVGKDMPF